MYNNFDYPIGADTPSAPWNSPSIPEKEFQVTASQTLSKPQSILTNNYRLDSYDEGPDTSDTNWAEEWHNNDHYTPLQLINLFKQHLQQELNRMGNCINKKRYIHLIEECSSWTEDEVEYTES